MSRRLLTVGIVAAVAFGPAAYAAVVVTALPTPLLLRDEFFGSFHPVDIDNNGTTDFTFAYAVSSVGLRTEAYNRAIITLDPPPNIGGPVFQVSSGYSIGPTLIPTDFDDPLWSSSDFLGGFVLVGESAYMGIVQVLSTGSSSSFNGRGVIGVEFEGLDGIHFGYIDIEAGPGYAGITLYGWAYESQPGVGILASQVPESSTLILVGVAAMTLISRRRRK